VSDPILFAAALLLLLLAGGALRGRFGGKR